MEAREKKRRWREGGGGGRGRGKRLKRLLRLFPSICHVIVVLLKRKKRRRKRRRGKKRTEGKLDKSADWIGIGLSREFSDSFYVVRNSKEKSQSLSCYDGFESYHLIELPCLCLGPAVRIHNNNKKRQQWKRGGGGGGKGGGPGHSTFFSFCARNWRRSQSEPNSQFNLLSIGCPLNPSSSSSSPLLPVSATIRDNQLLFLACAAPPRRPCKSPPEAAARRAPHGRLRHPSGTTGARLLLGGGWGWNG